jgi:tripartite-type tricarboxylate transporter receptor subunit TctC
VLALTTAKRVPTEQWSTLQENGVADVDASNWVGLFAPKGTPNAVVQKLFREVNDILKLPDVNQRFAGVGAEAIGSESREAFLARINRDLARNKRVAEKADVRPD